MKIFSDVLEARYDVTTISVQKGDDQGLLQYLKNTDVEKFTHVLFHYTDFLKSSKYIKVTYPQIKLLMRSHNAELPHWIDHAVANVKHGKIAGLRYILIAIAKGYREFQSARLSDYILSVTPWETEVYWKKLGGKSKKVYVPYFAPDMTDNISKNSRANVCLCIMSPNPSAFTLDALKNLNNEVKKLTEIRNVWKFYYTGNADENLSKQITHVEKLGFVEDLACYLLKSKFICLLTPFGFGFKTKILEAINYGCIPIIYEKNAHRLPEEIAKYCVLINNDNKTGLSEILATASSYSLSNNNVNERLRDTFEHQLQQIFTS